MVNMDESLSVLVDEKRKKISSQEEGKSIEEHYKITEEDYGPIEDEQLYDDGDPKDGFISEPFDPKKVDIIAQTMVVANIINLLKDDRICLDPDFQRSPALWDDIKQSRLIESLIVRIPLPSFYFDMDDDNDSYIVVDGLQRLWAIRRFAAIPANSPMRLRLTGLEYLPDYNGYLYEELPSLFQRRIREQNIMAYVIRPGTPENVRNSIFTRINTGGVQLTPAEIKNSVYRGQAAAFLRELAHSEHFKKATNYKVRSERMQDCELVNRFLAFFILGLDNYQDNLEHYMNEVLKKLKKSTPHELKVYKAKFYQSMDTANQLFGEFAFRKIRANNKPGQLNKPLFECVSLCLAELKTEECAKLINNKDLFLKEYIVMLKEEAFAKTITSGTAKKVNIIKRTTDMRMIIRKILEIKEE